MKLQTFEGLREVNVIGRCVVCRSRLYVWADGDDKGYSGDPRGAIKEQHNYSPFVADEYGDTDKCNYSGADVPACFGCTNDAESYRRGLAIAKASWTKSEVI